MGATIGCVGCGNMGGAILRGLAEREDLTLMGLDTDAERVQVLCMECGMREVHTVKEMAAKADYLLLAVKPHQVRPMLKDLAAYLRTEQVVISIAAGVTLEQLKTAASGVCPMVRVMPNTPAMVGRGVFALCLDDPMLSDEQRDFVTGLFAGIGQAHALEERYFDAFTAIAGSGPAYVFYFMEAVIEAAVTLGFSRSKATEIVEGLFQGSARLALDSDEHVSVLREMVCSPGGATIAAVNHLDRMAVRGMIIDAVKEAARRSKEMGDE